MKRVCLAMLLLEGSMMMFHDAAPGAGDPKESRREKACQALAELGALPHGQASASDMDAIAA